MNQHTFVLTTRLLAATLALLMPAAAGAVTITYVNPAPQSRVIVQTDNDSSGYTINGVNSDPNAFSRNQTAYGPLPPPGQLANYHTETYAGAELGTDLNAPLGSGVRSVFAPFNPTFFRSSGQTTDAAGFYSSQALAHSGNDLSNGAAPWVIHVDPSAGETVGTPTSVTIDASIAGVVSAAGASVADASWNVTTTLNGGVIAGSASQTVVGSTSFSDSGSLTFIVPLGSTFELLVDYDLSTSGSGVGANSNAEVTASLVEVSAQLVMMNNLAVNCLEPVNMWPPNGEVVDPIGTYEVDNPSGGAVTVTARVFSNEPIGATEDDGLLAAERLGSGNGRFYVLMVGADDGIGEANAVCVGGFVPHSRSPRALSGILQDSGDAANAVRDALDNTDPEDIDPADFGLFE